MIHNYEDTQGRLKNAGSNLMYLLIGGGIGATVALLFAPKSGKELRHDASEVVMQGLETANNKVTHLKEVADDYYHKAQDKASEIYKVAFKAVNDGTNEAKAFADRVSGETTGGAVNNTGNTRSEQIPPIFESGKTPGDPRETKPGIL